MSFQNAITSRISLSTTSSQGANLGSTCFIAPGFFTKFRTTNYSSFQAVRDDVTISSTSEIYTAALTYFSQTNSSVPFYLGRRLADDITFTISTVTNSKEYAFELEVYDTTTLAGTDYTVSVTSDATATAAEISAALTTEINTTQAIANVTCVDGTGSITLTPAAGYSFIISETTTNMTESYATTEAASDVLSAIIDEIEDDFYFVTASDHTDTFVSAMATEVEATGSSDFPKFYMFSTADSDTLAALPDPAIDLLGVVKEGNYLRTAGWWSHEADEIFPELAPLAVKGSQFPASSNWKFMQLATVDAARNLVTDKLLTTANQGYIGDRNGNWIGFQRGVAFTQNGTTASGEFVDTVRGSDWINSEIETRLLNLQLNTVSAGNKISFLSSDQQTVLNVINGILDEAVSRKILTGYVPAEVEFAPTFADQSARTLNDVKWVGYLAGAINLIIVDGNLTFADEALA